MNNTIRNCFNRMIYSQNWNIGFTEDTPKDVVHNKRLSKINWLKHPFKDRWFADPFIVKETSTEVVVFAEELEISVPKGRLVELHIDKSSYRLLGRYVLLELDTHLSFPAFYYQNEVLYVYPENGASGSQSLYKYDEHTHSLSFVKELVPFAIADAIIFPKGNDYYMFATRSDSAQDGVLLLHSNSIDGLYVYKEKALFDKGNNRSRSAGNIFMVNSKIYRPVQDCSVRYGWALNIMHLDFENKKEEICLSLKPQSWRYNLGTHTINFGSSLCVIDGYGFLFPILGRLYYSKIITSLKKLFRK